MYWMFENIYVLENLNISRVVNNNIFLRQIRLNSLLSGCIFPLHTLLQCNPDNVNFPLHVFIVCVGRKLVVL